MLLVFKKKIITPQPFWNCIKKKIMQKKISVATDLEKSMKKVNYGCRYIMMHRNTGQKRLKSLEALHRTLWAKGPDQIRAWYKNPVKRERIFPLICFESEAVTNNKLQDCLYRSSHKTQKEFLKKADMSVKVKVKFRHQHQYMCQRIIPLLMLSTVFMIIILEQKVN